MRRSGFKGLVAAGVVATGIVGSTTAVAANDIFLKLTGIPGESQDFKHKNEIDVLSWSWGHSDGTAVDKNGKFQAACIQDVHIVKPLDVASPGLIMAGVVGQIIPEAILTMRKSGEQQQEYFTMKMTNVSIPSYQTGASAGSNAVQESVALHYQSVKFEYRRQKADGTLEPPVEAEWTFEECAKK